MISLFLNKLLIKLLPYTILLAFLFVKFFGLSYYVFLGIFSEISFIVSILTIRNYKIKLYTIYLLIFGVYVILSDIYVAGNQFSFYKMIFKNLYISFFCLTNIIENTNISREELKNMITPLLITILLSFVVIIIQQVYDPMFMSIVTSNKFTDLDAPTSEIRLFSIYIYTSIIDLALYFIPISALLISYYLKIKRIKLGILIAVIVILTTFLSKSRGTLIAALPLLLLFYLGRTKIYSAKKKVTTLLFIVFLSIPIYWLSEQLMFNTIIQDRILESSKGDFENKSAYTRIIAIQAFLNFYPDAPVFGAGNTKYGVGGTGEWNYKLDSFLAGRSSQIHVGVLALFYLYGAVGAFFYIMFYYKLFKRFYLVSKYTRFWGTLWGIMVIPILNLSMDWYMPFSAGILLCIVFNKFLENQITQVSQLKSKTIKC